MDTGSRRQLGFGDLIQLPEDMSAEMCFSQFFKNWEREKIRETSGQPSLFTALYTTFSRQWLFVGIVKVRNLHTFFPASFFDLRVF
jgi:hypothetical protein